MASNRKLLILAPIRLVLMLLGRDDLVLLLGWLDVLPFLVALGSIATSRLLPDEVVRVRVELFTEAPELDTV